MKKASMFNNNFNEAFYRLARDKSIKPWLKSKVVHIHQRIIAESKIVTEIHKGQMEHHAERDEEGRIIFENVPNVGMQPKVSQKGQLEIEKAMAPLMEEEIEIKPIPGSQLLEYCNAFDLAMLADAGVCTLPEEQEEPKNK